MGAVNCRPLVSASELQRAELRVQELAAENERLRQNLRMGGLPPPPPGPARIFVTEKPLSASEVQEQSAYFLVPEPPRPPSPHAAAGAAASARGPAGPLRALPALAPEDLEAMIAAAPKMPLAPMVADTGGSKSQGIVQAVPGVAAGRMPSWSPTTPVLLRLGRLPGSGKDEGLGAEQQRCFMREVQVLSAICHEHLVPLWGFCMPCLGLVHPWPEQGNLGALLRTAPPDPSEGFHALAGAARGLLALHEMRLVHRDVKSTGIYLYDTVEGNGTLAKLGDCGLVCEPDEGGEGTEGTVVGTPPYIDPLHLHSGRYYKASDIFSLGVVLLEVLVGRSAAELGEPDARPDRQLGSAASVRASFMSSANQDQSMVTRRPRAPPLWVQFGQMVGKGVGAGTRAFDVVLAKRPRPDWSKKALLTATVLLVDMLKVDMVEKDGANSPPGRPSAAAVVEDLEVAAALQDTGASPRTLTRRERLCVVCMDGNINTQLKPCGHSALCQACAVFFVGREEPCPICRKKVQAYEEGDFFSTFAP